MIRGDEHMMVHKSESLFISQTTKQQLVNPGRIPIELIEAQNGPYIGENDIERF